MTFRAFRIFNEDGRTLGRVEHISLEWARIFNAQGRLVSTLYDGPLSRGSHTLTWAPSRDLPGGAYFFRVESEGGLSTNGKVVLVR